MHVPLDTPTEFVTYNQTRFNKRKLADRILAHRLVDSELLQPGFVHTRGDKGWLLMGPVFHNGDLYRRYDPERGTIYGSISAMLEIGMPEVELLSEADLIHRALDQKLFLRLERHSDHFRLDVAMLHPWMTRTQPRSCAIYLDRQNRLAALNPELTAPYNKPHVRYRIVPGQAGSQLQAALTQILIHNS